jgi:DNA-binding SARP family transcriptional activator
LALSWDDQPLPLIRGPAARSLFAYLVTHRDRAHTRDLLIGIFWPDRPEAAARRRLSRALWQIRRAMKPHPVLLTEEDTVHFNHGLPLWLDTEAFEAAMDDAMAVQLYRGDFMAGYYDDWLLLERERLRERFLGILERLIDECKARADYAGALVHARQLVAEDPLREEAHREAMRLCHLLGRDNEALRQYQACRRVLIDEFGVEPAATTSALAAEIAVQIDPGSPPHLPVAPRVASLALLERPGRVPLVGRKRERAEVARLLELVADGSGGMVLVSGATGVGKTRLMQEVARDASWHGMGVAWGHSCELSAPPPYQPLVEVLHEASLAHLPQVWQQELGRLLPGLPTPPPVTLQLEQEKGRLLEALARALLALAQTAPYLVILEDVHWMDPASFEALRVLLPRLPAARLLVVATLRPEDLADQPIARQALMALEATRIPRRLELAPLSENETKALVQRVLGLAQPAPRFSRRLYTQTQGNPFFITETLWALAEDGTLYRDVERGWSTPWDDETDDYAEMPVPQTIAQSIAQRLSRLPSNVRELLSIAAVIGRRVPFDLWLAAGQEGADTMLTAAEELAQRGFLAEMDDAPGYCFTHEAIRQAVYDGLGKTRRQLYHRQVGAALERLRPTEVEALARHAEMGQDWPQAVRHARQAGERAQTIYANRQALDYYIRSDAWLTEGRVDWSPAKIARWRAELAEQQGQVHSLVGEYAAADVAFTRARQTLTDLGNLGGAARILNKQSFLHFIQDDYVKADRYAQLALDALPEVDPPADLQATALTHLGLSAWAQGRYDDAQPVLEKALTLFEQIESDPHGLSRCLNSLGLVHLEHGDPDLAERYFARSLALRQQVGDRRGEAWCHHNLGRAALARGDLAAAREKLERARAIFAKIEHPYGLETCARFLDQVSQAATQKEVAEREARRVISVRLPRSDAPLGRPLSESEHMTVSWTVDDPADRAIQSKAARRRQRLLRLLAEAQAQGAAPTHDHLAQALGVSRRTIERDVVALRRQGHLLPPTRGKMSE